MKKSNRVKIAFDRKDVLENDGINVILDIFRFSCTVACLLEKNKEIRIFSNSELAVAHFRNEKNSEIYSEMDLNVAEKFDNSPYLARYFSDPDKKAIVVTNSGSQAVMNSIGALEILIAGFHNLPYVIEYLKNKDKILLVPACLFFNREHIEDFIASEIFYNSILYKFDINKLMEIHKTGRVMELMQFRPQTAEKDLQIILNPGGIKVIPKAIICGVYAKVENVII